MKMLKNAVATAVLMSGIAIAPSFAADIEDRDP